MRFEELRLIKPLLDAVHSAGYETPTPIQEKVIPLVLDGRDIVACAQTGTGKTAAFALPIIQRLSQDMPTPAKDTARPPGGGPRRDPTRHKNGGRRIDPRTFRKTRTLVLAPTRELAQQILDSFKTYGRNSGLRFTAVYGGVNKNPQFRALRAGVDVLVATPGRLLDLMSEGAVRLDAVNVLVLDEADRMLDMGFMPDIRRILSKVPTQRQTLLLSATMPAPIRELAKDILNDPASVEVARVSSSAETVAHWSYRVEKPEKPDLLRSVLENTPFTRALVFTRTKHGADKVVRNLTRSGLEAAAIHGNKTQNARTRALAAFKSGKTAVLVATDIAARGLDVNDISHVINYDLTDEPETYVHRIGRTGRAGATGIALSFVSREDYGNLHAIERMIQTELQPAGDLPGYVAPTDPIPKPMSHSRRGKPKAGGGGGQQRSRFGQKNGSRNASRNGSVRRNGNAPKNGTRRRTRSGGSKTGNGASTAMAGK